MKRNLLTIILCFAFLAGFAGSFSTVGKPLKVGFSISIKKITPETMKEAKSSGISCIETSLGELIDKKTLSFNHSDDEIIRELERVKKATDDAGIEIWSVHMPFSEQIDISVADEERRQKVVAFQFKVLQFCRILKPEIVLFHPSFYLGLNERETRMSQMIKSAMELNREVKKMKATMVIENMLGFELLLPGGKRERPLCRTVEETVKIMNRLPSNIYAAVDMNHIKDPEKLIRAHGRRLKSVHVADGIGKAENHFFPCSGQGGNNWNAILAALDEAKYSGPFMFESAYEDIKDIKACYDSLYNAYLNSNKKK